MGIFDTQVTKRAIWDWANEAFQFSQEMADKYRHCPGVDPERLANAVRHAYWQSLITARYGPRTAKLIGDAHEAGEQSLDSLMDQHHNAWAQQLTSRWHGSFADAAKLAREEFYRNAVLVPANPAADAEIAEQIWEKDEASIKAAIKARIEWELTQGKPCPQPCNTKSPLIIDWTDPRVSSLPNHKPGLPRQ